MLNPDYRDILSLFAAEGVEYLVVGAYALAAHGHPRATGDIDLWVRPAFDHMNQRGALRAVKLGWGARSLARNEPVRTFRVKPHDPITDDLTPNTSGLGRLAAAPAIIDHRQRQKPARLIRIPARPRQASQVRSSKILS